jgi:hypothetical protein
MQQCIKTLNRDDFRDLLSLHDSGELRTVVSYLFHGEDIDSVKRACTLNETEWGVACVLVAIFQEEDGGEELHNKVYEWAEEGNQENYNSLCKRMG